MLGRIGYAGEAQACLPKEFASNDKYNRDEKEDLKTGIDLLFKFKHELDKLHPKTLDYIDQLLQRPRY